MLRSGALTTLAVLVLGPAARGEPALIAGPPGEEMEVEADRIVYAWEAQLLRLEGHVVARRGDAILRAGSGTLDRAHGVLKLEGGVLALQGRQVFLADAAVIDLNARTADLTKAVLFLKTRPVNPDAPRAGPNSLILHGARVREIGPRRYLAERVTLTPCDCAGTPDYELIADTAELEDDRAHLHGVDLRLFGATLPLFPLSLPLTGRQSGLLAPQFGFGPTIGFTYAQPLFFTLGPSYDFTVAPGVFTGAHMHGEAPGQRSIKGPRLGLEGRYAPAPGTAGSLALDLFYDLDQHDPGGTSPGRGYGGLRGVAHLAHRTESGEGVFAAQGLAASDVMVLRDQSPVSIENSYDLFTTDAGAWRARGPLTFGLDATLIQDMRVVQDPRVAIPEFDRKLLSGSAAGATMHRLPALFAQLAPVPVGPAMFSLEASAVQFARFGEPDPLERSIGFGPTDRGAAASVDPGNPDALPGTAPDHSRAPALRFDLSPRLTFSSPRSLPVDLSLEAGARADGWFLEGFSERNRARAYALLGARASVPLERQFGSTLHRIEPALEIRALSKHLQAGGPPIGDLTDDGGASFGAAPDAAQQGLARGGSIEGVPAARRPYDEIDFAAPVTGAVEATASLSQSLWTKPGRTPGRILRFDLFQDALLWAGGARARLGEASAVTAVQLGPGNVQANLRYDWALHDLSALGASAGVRDARGDEIHAAVGMLRGSSSERLRGGIDELFSAARFAVTPTALTGSAGAGGSTSLLSWLRLAYQAIWTPGDTPATFTNWLHSFNFTAETPCHCAGIQAALGFPFHDTHLLSGPSFSLYIDLKSLGSFSPL